MQANLSEYFDYLDAQLVPVWMILKFQPGGFDWTRGCLYKPVHSPFHRYMAEDIDDQIISLPIAQTELVVSPERPHQFGIQDYDTFKGFSYIDA